MTVPTDTACIIFSKDRAMQIDATLRSLAETCLDSGDLTPSVLFAATTEIDRRQYAELALAHPTTRFIGETNFQTDLLQLLADTRFVLFLVDDALFTANWSFKRVRDALVSDERLIGVSLRLGNNISWCYTLDQPQSIPPTFPVNSELLAFDYSRGAADFKYPLEVSSSLFRTADIKSIIQGSEFRNPNQLEVVLDHGLASLRQRRPLLASFSRSVAFTNPVNMVQTQFPNRHAEEFGWTSATLRRLFDSGVRIDLAPYRGYVTSACHEERPLQFQYDFSSSVSATIEFSVRDSENSLTNALVSFSSECAWAMPERPSSADFDVLFALSVLRRVSKNRDANWLTNFARIIGEHWHSVEREDISFRRRTMLQAKEDAVQKEEAAVWRTHLDDTIAEQNVELDKFRDYVHKLRDYNHELRRVVEVAASEISERRVATETLQRGLSAAAAREEALKNELHSALSIGATLNTLELPVQGAVDIASNLQRRLDAVYASTSWRITYPLRIVMSVTSSLPRKVRGIAHNLFAPTDGKGPISIGVATETSTTRIANAENTAGELFGIENRSSDTKAPAGQSSDHNSTDPIAFEKTTEGREVPLVSVLQVSEESLSIRKWNEQTLPSIEYLGIATVADEIESRLTAARGKYLLLTSGIANLEPTALERMVTALESNSSVPLIAARQLDEVFISEEPSIACEPSGLSWAVMLRPSALDQLLIDAITAGSENSIPVNFSPPLMPRIFTNMDLSLNHRLKRSDVIKNFREASPYPGAALATLFPRQHLPNGSEREPILIILPFLPVGGSESLLHRVLSGLVDEYEFIIVTTLPDHHAWHERFLRLTHYIYHLPDFLPPHLWTDFLLLKISQLQIRRVIVSGSFYGYTFLPHAKAASSDLQTYSLLHNDEWEGHRSNALKVQHSIDHFIAISKRISATLHYLDRIELSRIHTICNGVDTEISFSPSRLSRATARPMFGLPLAPQLIAFVGRLSSEKDPEAFLEVINRWPSRQDVEFAIFGKGPLEQQVRDRISALGKARIHWIPYVAPERMPEVFASIDLLVITSKSEGLPLVLLEAMAMEVPTVAYDVGDIASVIEDGVSGFIVPAGDLDALNNRVQQLIDDPQARIAMGKAARRRLEELGLTEQQMLVAYREVLSK